MISLRLQEIAEMVEKDKVVFDVGSDHALLPCFLMEQGICQKVYAGEVAKGPYENARKAIKENGYEGKIIPVFSDGLSKAEDDVQVVIIAGMGYYTIEHILDSCDPYRYDYFIVQSNTDVDLLRKYISDHHWSIMEEKVVHDGFFYQIVKFNTSEHEPYTRKQIIYGPKNLENNEEIFREYLRDLHSRLSMINVRANREEYRLAIKEIEDILGYNC